MRFITIFISLVGLCFFACHSNDKTENKPELSRSAGTVVKTFQVRNQSESNVIHVLGAVMSETEARPSFKVGGVIRKTYVKAGDMVKKGQLLATLEMDEIDAQVKLAEEGLRKSDRDLARVKNLYADSVATLEQLQNTTTALEVSKRNAEIARFNRSYAEIRSPISGKIVKQVMFNGEITGPGNPVYAILGVGSKDWVIRAGLTDRDWARVELNDDVTINMDAYPGQSFKGLVSSRSSIGINSSGTIDIEIKFKNQPARLAAGLIADLTIVSAKNDYFKVIPIEALVKSDGKTASAFTVVNGLAKKIDLTIAKLLGDHVAISSGLDGVEVVVTTGAMYLEEGDKITYWK